MQQWSGTFTVSRLLASIAHAHDGVVFFRCEGGPKKFGDFVHRFMRKFLSDGVFVVHTKVMCSWKNGSTAGGFVRLVCGARF